MSVPLVVNGAVFNYPQNFDEEWGVDATGWAVAVTAGMLSLSGGNFPLTAPVNFGTSFGINVKSLTSITANPATVGYLLLAKTDTISFRNNANTGNLLLGIDGSNNLTFNGVALGTTSLANTHIFVGNASNVPTDVAVSGDATMANTGALTIANGAITNAKIAASTGISLNKLAALSASQLVVSDGSGFLSSASSPSLTEIGYVAGATSSLQMQINNVNQVPSGAMMDFGGTVAPSGWLVCDGSSYLRTDYPSLWSAIGSSWGAIDSTHFNVPNMTRRTGIGSGGAGTGTIGNAVGNTGGEETHTLSSAEIPATSVTVSISDPGHNHFVTNDYGASGSGGSALLSTNSQSHNYRTGNSTTGISASGSVNGSGGAHNNIQPSAVVLKIIKI